MNADGRPGVPQPARHLGWTALEANALRGKGFRDRLLHLVEEAGPGDRNHDRRDECQKKGFHGVLPLSYSAGAAAAERALPWASRAFCCSSQRLWCSLAQLTSTVPEPIASN